MTRKHKERIERRKRIHTTLRPTVRAMGETLARHDGREFNLELEWLIEAEYSRRFNNAAA